MGCMHSGLNHNEQIVQRYLTNPDAMDYPRAAAKFEAIGSHEYAILCWLAASRPSIAESIYERCGLSIIDNSLEITPIWRMIRAAHEERTADIQVIKDFYLQKRRDPWIARVVAAI
jgi:hypothetical protein